MGQEEGWQEQGGAVGSWAGRRRGRRKGRRKRVGQEKSGAGGWWGRSKVGHEEGWAGGRRGTRNVSTLAFSLAA